MAALLRSERPGGLVYPAVGPSRCAAPLLGRSVGRGARAECRAGDRGQGQGLLAAAAGRLSDTLCLEPKLTWYGLSALRLVMSKLSVVFLLSIPFFTLWVTK